MKKTTTLLFVLLMWGLNYAQITFTVNDMNDLYKEGSVSYNLDGYLGLKMDIGAPSPNAQSWVFPANAVFEDTTKILHLSPKGTPYESSFPNATHCMKVDIGAYFSVYNYLRIADNLMIRLGSGIAVGTSTTAPMVDIDTSAHFPIQYQSKFVSVRSTDLGNGDTEIETVTDNYDAWGKITLPWGTFDCIRCYSVSLTARFTNGKPTGVDTMREISFLSKAARISFDLQTDTKNSGVVYLTQTEMEIFNQTTDVESENIKAESFALYQNYPNPFNPETVISYQLPANCTVQMKVYNLLGKEVASLVNEEQSAGYHKVQFNASDLPSGVYYYKINAGSHSMTQKMMLVK